MSSQSKKPDQTPGAMKSEIANISKLRLSQNFGDQIGVRKLITTIPVRRPGRQDFIQVHPSDDYRLETAVIELKEERETYLVAPELWPEVSGELVPKILHTYISRQGVLSLWPIRLPSEDGRIDTWNASAMEAAELARARWIRIAAKMSLGAYEVFEATSSLPEPEWPELDLQAILGIAFRDRYITNFDHPVLRRLRGDL